MQRVTCRGLIGFLAVWALLTVSMARAQSPVSWWSGDGNANDVISGNNGVPSGGVTYAPGAVNQAFSFDGSNGVVLIPDVDSLKITGSISITATVKANTLPGHGQQSQILFRGDSRTSYDPYWLGIKEDGTLTWHVGDATGAFAEITTPMVVGRFVAIIASLDNATGIMRLFVDGQLVASGTTAVRPFGDLDPNLHAGVAIGNTADTVQFNQPFNGLIDEVKIYNTVVAPVPNKADFNGDRYDDLVFQNSTTGQIVFWFLNGTHVIDGAALSALPASGYKVRGVGDFNQDGSADLVFQNSTTGQIAIWFLSGTHFIGGASVGLVPLAGYQVVGVGDFNGDGQSDIVLQNTTTNQVVIWFMNGTNVMSGSFISSTPAAGYQVVGVSEMNGDQQSDLILQNSQTGQIVIWYMKGITVTGGVSLPLPAQGYRVVGTGAFNSSSGLALQNSTTNQIALWYIGGNSVVGGGLVSGTPTAGYQVVGPR